MVGKDSESEVSEHLYDLILELHAIDSSVLLAVMPQLEFKLKVYIIATTELIVGQKNFVRTFCHPIPMI